MRCASFNIPGKRVGTETIIEGIATSTLFVTRY